MDDEQTGDNHASFAPAEPDQDHPDRLEAVVEQEADDIEEIKERIEVIATVAERAEFWSGPMPSADSMGRYKEVSSEIVPAILADFVRQSEASVQAQAHHFEIERRKLAIEEREQTARIEGDRSDIQYRWVSGAILWLIALGAIAILGGAAWRFFDAPSSSGSIVIVVIALLLAVIVTVVGGKGRLTQIESDTQVGSLSWIADAVKGSRNNNYQIPTNSESSQPPD